MFELTCNNSKTAALDFQELDLSTICSMASKHEGITDNGTITWARYASVTAQSLARFGSKSFDSFVHNIGRSL